MNTLLDTLSARLSLRASVKSKTQPQLNFPLNPVAESFYHLSTLMNTHSCEWLQIQGQVDPNICAQAIYHACLRHPLTRSRLIPPTPFKRASWTSGPSSSLVPLWTHSLLSSSVNSPSHFTPTQSGHFPTWLTQVIWDRPAIDPTQEDPVEFHLLYEYDSLQKCVKNTHFLIVAPHLCTDARAGTRLLDEIATLYAYFEKSSEVHDSSANTDSLTHFESKNQFEITSSLPPSILPLPSIPPLDRDLLQLPQLSRLQKLHYTLKGAIQCVKDLCQPAQGFDLPSAPRGQTGVYVHRVDQDELQTVLKAARKAKITAHALFTWALTQVYKERYQTNNPSHLSVPLFRVADLFSLCPWLPTHARDQFEVLVQPYTTTLDPDWSTQDAFQTIHHRLNSYKKGAVLVEIPRVRIYTFFARILPFSFLKRQLLKYVFKTNVTTTNPGRVPAKFENFGTHDCLDFINFPQIAPPARLGIIYTTFQNQLRVVTLYDQALFTSSEIEDLTDELWAKIKKLADQIHSQN